MGVLRVEEKHNIDLISGFGGLKACSSGVITFNQLESMRRVITRYLRKSGKVIIRIRPETLLTKKAVGVRMGKGKGKGSDWVCKVKAGSTIVEVRGKSMLKIEEALKYGSKKLPLNVHIMMYSV